jgi:hypothetical protein
MRERSGDVREDRAARPVRRDDLAVRKELTGVVEEHHSVAEQAPTLVGVGDQDLRGVVIGGAGGRTRGLVLAHGCLTFEVSSLPGMASL